MTAYATIDDVTALFETAPGVRSKRYARLSALLEPVTDELIRECGGRDYFRHPANIGDPDVVWYASGDGTAILHVHQGLVSLTELAISQDGGMTFAVVPSTEYWLIGSDPASSVPVSSGEPYFHIRLVPWGSYRVFPAGPRTVRLTGVYGWPAIPKALVEGVAERVRQLAFADPSYEGTVPGDDMYGRPTVSTRWPQATWNFLMGERHRFWCHV